MLVMAILSGIFLIRFYMNKYRIIEICYNRFEPQIKRWWFPIWRPIGYHTHQGHGIAPASYNTLDEAIDVIRTDRIEKIKSNNTFLQVIVFLSDKKIKGIFSERCYSTS